MKALNIDTTKETQVFDYQEYWDMDTFAKSQGYDGAEDPEFMEDYGTDDFVDWSDIAKMDWLGEQQKADIDSLLDDYQSLEVNYYIAMVANLEKWNGKAQAGITILENITDIFSYRGSIELTAIYEGENYLKFCISHHDGDDTYYVFFNTVEYNEGLCQELEDCILNGLAYKVYKSMEKEYYNLIYNIVDKYNQDYINSCINIKQELKRL